MKSNSSKISHWFDRATQNVLGSITRVITQEEIVALTFDDGPHPEFTPRMLKILAQYKARATFFMVGKAAQAQPTLVQQVAHEGHAIGNHTWDHPSMPFISGRERRAQLRACAQAIAPYGARLFRPPYGHQNLASYLDAMWLGYQVVTWNVVVNDWSGYPAEKIVDQVANRLKPGSIVLMHDALYTSAEKHYADREATLKAVELLLEQMSSRFRFVTVPELLQRGHPLRRNWYKQGDPEWLNGLEGQDGETQRYYSML